jgi:hypothetical protein
MSATTTTAPWWRGATRARGGTIVIDALRLPDGITCGHCRRARAVTEEECRHCDAAVRARG